MITVNNTSTLQTSPAFLHSAYITLHHAESAFLSPALHVPKHNAVMGTLSADQRI